jgi:hypothetical protein
VILALAIARERIALQVEEHVSGSRDWKTREPVIQSVQRQQLVDGRVAHSAGQLDPRLSCTRAYVSIAPRRG